ncbi:MAG: GGDEF domain-containing protein [Chloroflexota bacterium]
MSASVDPLMIWSMTATAWLASGALAAGCLAAICGLQRQRRRIAGLTASLEACNERALAHARELERQALEDDLTGLHNRRFMDTDLPREFERTQRFGREFTLAILDVDGFKQINDRYSHQLGDRVLADVAAILQSACRTMDGVVRYGGDEFVLYFPEAQLSTGRNICQRVLKRVHSHGWQRLAPDLAVTLSIGLASSHGAESAIDLLEMADSRLRSAKQAGKDRICSEDAAAPLVNVA